MRFRRTFIPVTLAAGFAAYVALHPGIAYSEPRMASGRPTPLAQLANYTIDPMHTSVYFEITHLGLSQVHGRINKFSGKIHEDSKDLTQSTVEFSAKTESIDTGVAPRDADLRGAGYFDAVKFPDLTFKSTKVEKSKEGYVVTGDLTIKDKTKQVSIPFKHYGPLKLNMGDMSTRIGVVAEPIAIKRSDFGVGNQFKLPDGTLGASDEVIVRISLEGTLDK